MVQIYVDVPDCCKYVSDFIGVNWISYMATDPMSQESDLLIYPGVIFSNTIHTIGQDLTTFSKTGTHR